MDLQKHYNQLQALTLGNVWYREQVKRYILDAVHSDAHDDVTAKHLIKRSTQCVGKIVCKQAGVMAGLQEITWVSKKLGLAIKPKVADGATIKSKQVLALLKGPARNMLAAERTLLNTLQHLSGVATLTHAVVQQVGRRPIVCATRKTLWGALDKRAVALGGGYTHRLGLFDGVMVKDNHQALVSIKNLMTVHWPLSISTCIEIASLTQLKQCVIHYPHYKTLLLDNFTPVQLKQAVRWLTKIKQRQHYMLEASGGITPLNVMQFAKTGVDAVSLGALTHSAPALDISLDIIPEK